MDGYMGKILRVNLTSREFKEEPLEPRLGRDYNGPPDGGDSANLLTPTIGDASTIIPESKAFLVNVEKKGRR